MLKKRRKLTVFITSCVTLIVLIFSCVFIPKCIENIKKNDYEPEWHEEYVSNLTEEQHLQNLVKITEEIFAEEIEEGEIVNYKVELVYAFYDNDPEYFLIELEFAEEFIGSTDGCYQCEVTKRKHHYVSKYRHLIGYHNNDKYRYGVGNYCSGNRWAFRPGQSPYTYLGYANEKKYYGAEMFGVEKDGKILCVYSSSSSNEMPVGEGCEHNELFSQYEPSREQQYQYMKDNNKWTPSNYSKDKMSGKFREEYYRTV